MRGGNHDFRRGVWFSMDWGRSSRWLEAAVWLALVMLSVRVAIRGEWLVILPLFLLGWYAAGGLWRAPKSRAEPAHVGPPYLLLIEARGYWAGMQAALVAVGGAMVAVWAAGGRRPFTAAVAALASGFVLHWRRRSSLANSAEAWSAWRRGRVAGPTVLFIAYLMLGGGSGDSDEAVTVAVAATPLENPKPVAPKEADPSAHLAADGFPGVVMYTEEQSAVLVPPVSVPSASRGRAASKDSEIPFHGVYWFLRQGLAKPPPEATVAMGQPDVRVARSTDSRPLHMEARQNLGRMVDLRCCRAVEVTVRNADISAGSVWLEVQTLNTATGERRSLGRQAVQAMPVPGQTVNETLRFAVKAPAGLFDELRFVFHLDQWRGMRSAKIAIDHTKLIAR